MRLLTAVALVIPGIFGCTEATAPGRKGAAELRKPVALSFDARPMDGLTGLPLARVAVTARDSLGRIATSFSGVVTVTLSSNAERGTLLGTLTAHAVLGVAHFVNLRVSDSGSTFTLGASADGMMPAVSPSFAVSPPADRVAFVCGDDPVSGLYVANVDGTGVALIVSDTGWLSQPAWSRDGTRLAYVANGDVWTVNADGTNPKRLITQGLAPAWSAGDDRLMFARPVGSTSTEIDDVAANGTALVQHGTWPISFTASSASAASLPWGEDLRWSPNGQHVAFTLARWLAASDPDGFSLSIRRVYVMNRDGTRGHLLSPYPDSVAFADQTPAWSLDGQLIAYYTAEGGIAVIATDTGAVPSVLAGWQPDADADTYNSGLTWSPDALQLAAARITVRQLPGFEPMIPVNASTFWESTFWLIGRADQSSRATFTMNGRIHDLAWRPRTR